MPKTPTYLIEAIENGKKESDVFKVDYYNQDQLIKTHVKDFLAQKFNKAMLEKPEMADYLNELFKRCTE